MGDPIPGTPEALRRYWEERKPLPVTWVLPAHLCEGDPEHGPVYIGGFPGQPVPRVGDKVIGPDDMGMVEVADVIWDYMDGFYPSPRGVQVVCQEIRSE